MCAQGVSQSGNPPGAEKSPVRKQKGATEVEAMRAKARQGKHTGPETVKRTDVVYEVLGTPGDFPPVQLPLGVSG